MADAAVSKAVDSVRESSSLSICTTVRIPKYTGRELKVGPVQTYVEVREMHYYQMRIGPRLKSMA